MYLLYTLLFSQMSWEKRRLFNPDLLSPYLSLLMDHGIRIQKKAPSQMMLLKDLEWSEDAIDAKLFEPQ